ncbi:MAG: EamA family transporter [Longimicrobiales bacterium]|nr:EamA family transporter [Longimicrobiales bacterium]
MSQPSLCAPRSTDRVEPTLTRIVLAFAAVYFIWGSTYLAIRFAIETMPPLAMAAARFLTAGTLLFAWALSRGAPMPSGAHWRAAAISGTLLLAGGNGAIVIAEQWVPSGLVALLVASVPLWMVILDRFFGSRVKPTRRTVIGLTVGFSGVALLAGSPGVGAGGSKELLGALFVMGGSLCWAAGSLHSRYIKDPPRPRMLVAMQMLSGGTVLSVLAALTGDWARLDIASISGRSWVAFGYLILAGALIGYAAYIWLLTVVPPARAGTYAYVNPVVAMLLGWAFAGEPLAFRSLGAAAIILGSVVVITTEASAKQSEPSSRNRLAVGTEH